jgi:hypothetical protein
MIESRWYYCIEHGTVEPFGGCPAKDRLGPYATKEEAAKALQMAQDRNEEWDHDTAWNDDEDDEDNEDNA